MQVIRVSHGAARVAQATRGTVDNSTVAVHHLSNPNFCPVKRGQLCLLSEKQIKRGTHRSTIELEQAIRKYLTIHNEKPKPVVRTKTADEILASLARFCKRISDSGH